jgi:beta-mannosidase
MRSQSLNGSWEFRQRGEGRWRDASVPGGVYSDLLACDVIADPYEADNELELQWVGKTDWEYRRTFEVGADLLDHEVVRLRCLGLDTVATVSVNGVEVGTADNMHREYEFDVGDALSASENEIRVVFDSPVEYGVRRADDHPYEVPGLSYPVEQPDRNFVRKAQCHYGWDWGPCLPTVGIWRDVELVGFSGPRVQYVTTEQDHEAGNVQLTARIGVEAVGATDATLAVEIADASATEPVSLEPGTNEAVLSVEVENPDLWWPAGDGDQPLYGLDVRVEANGHDHAVTNRVGFREVELVREADDAGQSFGFEVNGRPIFAKGANWIPIDALHARTLDRDRYEGLLRSAADANMNTIRVWGGGFYERDHFYELCDELGLLVWQDVMFSCSLYPADDAFLDSVEREVRDQARRLANHPSLALWCGNNEIEQGIERWFADADHIDRLTADYEVLFYDRIPDALAEEDPSRAYWPSSPSSATVVDDPYDEGSGDLHFWDVWHDGEPFAAYEDSAPRFVSEFGYQSFPSADLLRTVVPEDQLNPTAPLLEHHQRHPRGNRLILQRMAEHFRIPFDFEDFVYLSQVQHGIAMKTAIEHWRRLQPHCAGTLYWQLNDLWPVASWSSVEYGGEWKALQHVARRIYAPVLVSTVGTGSTAATDGDGATDEVDVWLTNDSHDPLDGTVDVSVETFDGETVFSDSVPVDLGGFASESVYAFDPAALASESDEVLVRASYRGTAETYEEVAFLEPYKHLSLPDAQVEATVEGDAVTVSADGAALFVELRAGDLDGRFSDNYFHLPAGEERTVRFEIGDPSPIDSSALERALDVRHLRDTY